MKVWKFNTVPRSFMSNRVALALILGELTLGITGFMYFEGNNLREAFYLTIITIATVGFGELRPFSPEGQMFVSFLIILNFGIFAYALSVFSYYVINGEIFKKMHLSLIGKKIEKLEQHVIVCGYGRYGREVSLNFLHHKIPFVVIDHDPEVIEGIQKSESDIVYIEGDATNDEILQTAGILRAKSLISALADDTENLYIVLTARQLNPQLNIISRASFPKSPRKLQLAGANHVVMPEQIGGFYMASLVSKPGATEFFSYITREAESDIEFEEIHYRDMPAVCRGKTMEELHIRRSSGANIIGFKDPAGRYIVNPEPGTVLRENSSFIVLGTHEQLGKLRKYLKEMN